MLTVFHQYRRILIARIASWPVEGNGIVPLPNNNNTGVAKISPLVINPIRYERDYLAKSIFGRYATLGGIWTFMNGVFSTIFGSTLLLILLGASMSLKDRGTRAIIGVYFRSEAIVNLRLGSYSAKGRRYSRRKRTSHLSRRGATDH
jgi:hypothetical protein